MLVRALASLILLFAAHAALAETRVALVVGVSGYSSAGRLPNAAGDAAAIGKLLAGTGFAVTEVMDPTRRTLKAELAAFEQKAAAADVALIYFSGHGMEIGGENWLLPVDAELAHERDVEDETISLTRLRDSVREAKRLKVIILDACRNNPFLPRMARAKKSGLSRGLARVETEASEIIAYAAADGTTAADGDGAHSPYTTALLARLTAPRDIRFVFGDISDDVRKATTPPSSLAAETQRPAAYFPSLGGGDVYLLDKPAGPVVAPPPPDMSCVNAGAHWNAIRAEKRRDYFEDHLHQFKGCGFDKLAAEALAALDKVEVAIAVPPPPVVAREAPERECDRLLDAFIREAKLAEKSDPPSTRHRETAASAVPACTAAAEKAPDSAERQFKLAKALYGSGDRQAGLGKYRQAAEMGHAEAQYMLGAILGLASIGKPTTDPEAHKWMRRAADQGFASAQQSLGSDYRHGLGVKKDFAEALRWYQRAAAQNDVLAMEYLGSMHENGEGVPRDMSKALDWYQKAALQNSTDAQIRLGGMYFHGQGVAKDPAQAFRWYRTAADRENGFAQFMVGRMFQHGLGRAKNLEEARRWYERAATNGNEEARKLLGKS